MSTVDVFLPAYKLNRQRTLGLLEQIEQLPDPIEALGWRPGPGRAHIAWQLMHIGITEELFASERLAPHMPGMMTELWPRFRGGSTPDDDIPTAETIHKALGQGRERLVATLSEFGDDRLGEIPAALAARKLTILDVLHILGWHEGHHQGQAHITFNLWKNRGP
jgi:uncharacterized damage-inducible protein DinB